MSDASYAFLPWIRRGLAAEISRVDGAGPSAPRATAPVKVRIEANQAPAQRDVTVDLALYGPGEIGNVDRRMVVRVVPESGSHDVEPNYFPTIEFHQPDFPWRYTPARANAKDRLRTWLVLVVLTGDEISERAGPGSKGRLPSITVPVGEALPDLSQSWAWAHVAVAGVTDAGSANLQQIADQEPNRTVSRLLCARRLKPTTSYRAFLVPAFERGRLAGLRKPVPEALDALTPAWTAGGGSVELPVYYEWHFETGIAGDFEYLVRKLRARALPSGVGTRDMDAQSPDPALPAASATPMGLEGALRSPDSEPTPWPPAERGPFVSGLKTLVDRPADLLVAGSPTRIVAPPLYARTYTKQDRLNDGAQPRWFNEMNADPRHRVAAGLGTRVVQEHQEELMAAAWDKVEGILALNEKLRRSQLAREVARRLHTRHVKTLNPSALLELTAPMHQRLLASPMMLTASSAGRTTVAQLVAASPIAQGATSAAFRRVVRERGPVRARQKRAGAAKSAIPLLERMNRGVAAAPKPRPVDVAVTPAKAAANMAPTWFDAGWRSAMAVLPWVLLVVVILLVISALALSLLSLPAAPIMWILAGLLGPIGAAATSWGRKARNGSAVRDSALTGDDVRTAFVGPSWAPGLTPVGSFEPVATQPSPGATARMRQALGTLLDDFGAPPEPGPTLVPLDLPRLRTDMVTRIDPRLTIAAALGTRLRIPDSFVKEHEDPLEPVLAAPEFERPMYEPLRDLSQDWLLPGVDQIPQNTVTLAKTNQAFVECYMLGLNHELGRELVWREYPTDRRGTYFRQFWDVRGYAGTAEPAELKDIKRILESDGSDGWNKALGLGWHSSRRPPPGGDHLVFLVKGEVLRRYPNTDVYAVKAILDASGKRVLSDQEVHPVFEGRLRPDIAFFGFELTAEQVHGDPDPDEEQGWFFMLQEQPTQPRFGLDIGADVVFGGALGDWNDLSWKHLVANQDGLDSLSYIDLDAALPNTAGVTSGAGEPSVAWHADAGQGTTGATSADLAYITLQRPFRVALHGSDMLAED